MSPKRPLDKDMTTWGNDISERLRAVERYKTKFDPPDDGGAGGPYTMTVAAVNTPSPMKDRADLICSGTNDAGVVQEAIDRMQASDAVGNRDLSKPGGTVHLMSGAYDFVGENVALGQQVRLRGSGRENTVISNGAITSKGSVGSGFTVTQLAVEDLSVDGPITFSDHPFGTIFSVRACTCGGIGTGNGGLLWATDNFITDSTGISGPGLTGGIVAYTHRAIVSGNIIGTPNPAIEDSGIELWRCEQSVVSGNTIYLALGNIGAAARYGILLDGQITELPLVEPFTHNVSDNVVFLAAGSTANTHTGIKIGLSDAGAAYMENIGVFGNRLITDDATSWKYGIHAHTKVYDSTFAHNCINNAGTARVFDQGVNNMDWMNWCGATPGGSGSGVGVVPPSLVLKDEGSTVATIKSLNFVGGSVVATAVGSDGTATFTSSAGREYATFVIAADDTNAAGKAAANYLSSTDIGATLDTALAALPTINGKKRGRILLLEGTYEATSRCLIDENYEDVEIRGVGWGTRIVAQNSTMNRVFDISDLTPSAEINRITIADLMIDANDETITPILVGNTMASNQLEAIRVENIYILNARGWATQPYSIYMVSDNSVINRCHIVGTDPTVHQGVFSTSNNNNQWVTNCWFDGVREGIVGGSQVTGNKMGEIETCGIRTGGVVQNNDIGCGIGGVNNGHGIEVTGSRTVCKGNRITQAFGGNGIHVTGEDSSMIIGNTVGWVDVDFACIHVTGATEGPIISGNSFDSPDGTGIKCLADSSQIVGNMIDWTGQHGIWVSDHSFNVIHDNKIHFGGWGTTDTYAGIFVDGDSNENSIQGNHIRSTDFKYGIRIDNSTCDDNLVTNNDLLNSAVTASFSDAGTGTITTAGNRL